MTPKQKADALINHFRVIFMQSDSDVGEEILSTTLAKKCALKSITFIETEYDEYFQGWLTSDREVYWKEVKKCINEY